MPPKFDHVFIIDDDTASRFVCEKIIQFLNLTDRLIFFENGEDALQYFDTYTDFDKNKDLIFLDLDMPIMNGFEFIEAVKLHQIYTSKMTLAVLATTSMFSSKVQSIRKLGIQYYISKPLNIDKMREFCSKLEKSDPEKFSFIK